MPEVKLVSFGDLTLDFRDCCDGDVEIEDADESRVLLTIDEFIAAAEWLKLNRPDKTK